MTARILLIDDDPHLCQIVSMALERSGYESQCVPGALPGLRMLYDLRPDLVILDIMLPGMDGWEMLQRIREMADVPVLVLSAKGRLADRLRGLSAGADDYLAKPFNLDELLLRVAALLHRAERGRASDRPAPYFDGYLQADPEGAAVSVSGRPVKLTSRESRLFFALLCRRGQVVPSAELLQCIGGEAYALDEHCLKNYIYRLRKKIEPDPAHPHYIETKKGLGYRFGGKLFTVQEVR
ncbi:MAG: response regulator transcription factor [Chloroflexi bacterium]|nr:response regulator transcription factor [Chloroflexota bacterium]